MNNSGQTFFILKCVTFFLPLLIIFFIFMYHPLIVQAGLYNIDTSSNYTLPNSKFAIAPEHNYLMNKDLLDIAMKRLDNTITIFGILMSLIVFVFGGALAFLQYQSSNNLDDKFKSLEKQHDIESMKMSINVNNMVEANVNTLFNKFAERYKNEVYDNVIQFTTEALLLSSESREILNSRNRRAVSEIKSALKNEMDSLKLGKALELYATDWLTIQRIFSKEKKQKLSGLDDFININQIPELETYLNDKLLKEYKGDSDLEPRVKLALKVLSSTHLEKI